MESNSNPNQQQNSNQSHINQHEYSQHQSQTVVQSKTDTLGIVSIVLAFFIPLAGLIVGIVGKDKAKKEGYSGTLSSIGTVISLTFIILTFLAIIAIFVLTSANSGNSLAKVNDTIGKNNINATHVKLEEYYNLNKSYPDIINSTYLPTLDSSAINEFSGNFNYRYQPSGCTENKCRSYVLTYNLEFESTGDTSVYTKTSLNK